MADERMTHSIGDHISGETQALLKLRARLDSEPEQFDDEDYV